MGGEFEHQANFRTRGIKERKGPDFLIMPNLEIDEKLNFERKDKNNGT
jgi:hypothetical protein